MNPAVNRLALGCALMMVSSVLYSQSALDHKQERIIRVEALKLFNSMNNLGTMNNGKSQFVDLFESEGSSEVPNDIPPVCDALAGSSRASYGEPMNVLVYAEEMESLRNPQVNYSLLDLGNLKLSDASGTIDVFFEKRVQIKKECKVEGLNSQFPTGMKVKQKALVHFRIEESGRVDRKSFRIRSIVLVNEAVPTFNAYVLIMGTEGLYPGDGIVLKMKDGNSISAKRRGILPDGVDLDMNQFIPDNFWTFLTEEGSGKTKKAISGLKNCNCQGRPFVLYNKRNRLDLGIQFGTPKGSIKEGSLQTELPLITPQHKTISLGYTRYFAGQSQKVHKLAGLNVHLLSEDWSISATTPFQSKFNATDPDGDAYIRNAVIDNYSEVLTQQQVNVSLEGGIAYSEKSWLIEGRVGIDYVHTLSSGYDASANALFEGQYPDLFGVTMAQNGIYDFGTYALTKSGASPMANQGWGGHVSGGLSWRPIPEGIGIGIYAHYQRTEWIIESPSDQISTGPTELFSTFSISNGVTRSLFAVHPRIFLQF